MVAKATTPAFRCFAFCILHFAFLSPPPPKPNPRPPSATAWPLLPTTSPPIPPPRRRAGTIPREALVEMYERELGNLYNPPKPTRFTRLRLIEKYFATNSSEDHKALAKWIDSLGVDPTSSAASRAAHGWPALETGVYTSTTRSAQPGALLPRHPKVTTARRRGRW